MFQVYTRLNQVGIAVSYDTTLSTISKIAKLHQVPIKHWLSTGTDIKLVGDNVDKNVKVRDMRSDHRGAMVHMYSMLVVKSRVQSAGLSTASRASNLTDCSVLDFLPSQHDLDKIRGDLVILVSRILCKYIKSLKPLLSSVDKHITHHAIFH